MGYPRGSAHPLRRTLIDRPTKCQVHRHKLSGERVSPLTTASVEALWAPLCVCGLRTLRRPQQQMTEFSTSETRLPVRTPTPCQDRCHHPRSQCMPNLVHSTILASFIGVYLRYLIATGTVEDAELDAYVSNITPVCVRGHPCGVTSELVLLANGNSGKAALNQMFRSGIDSTELKHEVRAHASALEWQTTWREATARRTHLLIRRLGLASPCA